ncbi:MAG TPA: acyl carrier protein [Kofleriaceae bacterium]|nr:acyl carrier protein [Kofleriaceae bacterium]
MNATADQILALLHQIAPDVDPSGVDRSLPLPDQLDLDSMDYQSLLAAISKRYAMPIPEADVAALRSVDDLTAYVEAHAGAARIG